MQMMQMAQRSKPRRVRRWAFEPPLKTERELRFFVQKAFRARIPDKQICPNHSTPWRAFADAYFARSPVAVWKASRGFGGKTYLLGLLSSVEAALLGADVNVLGGSAEQAARVLEHTQTLWNNPNAPRQVLRGEIQRRTTFAAGNTITALAASSRSVRGPHPQRLRCDEIDEVDLPILDAAMGQPMTGRGVAAQTVLSSTHQYANGTMSEVLRRAADKGWPVYEWCWKETQEPHGWLTQAAIDQKRQEVTAAMWAAEYDLQEPSPENRAILPQAVDRMFDTGLGRFEGRPGEYIEIEPPGGGRYTTGVDWARKQDWTEIVTLRLDVTPARIVAYERMNRKPWPQMIERFEYRIRRFKGQAYHDGTGIGDVVDGYLTVPAQGVMMVGRPRNDMLSECIAAIERGEIVSPFIRHVDGSLRYASVDDVFGAGHLPDTLAALSLAWLAAKTPAISVISYR